MDDPMIMGILNVTPDSFSDGGSYFDPVHAVEKAHTMITAGADIIDIGGESTRPGSLPVIAEEELKRVVPVIDALSKSSDVLISVDTQKSSVAEAALQAGAHIVNDVSAGTNDESMFNVVCNSRAGYIMMHMQGTPATMQSSPEYDDILTDIKGFFNSRVQLALQKGIQVNQMVLDPGIGFGKTLEDNLTILANINTLRISKLPLLIGASRKSFIGMVDESTVDKRLGGSLAAVIATYINKTDIFRVHDVAETKQVLDIFTAIQKHSD